jgi:hypothetical protein
MLRHTEEALYEKAKRRIERGEGGISRSTAIAYLWEAVDQRHFKSMHLLGIHLQKGDLDFGKKESLLRAVFARNRATGDALAYHLLNIFLERKRPDFGSDAFRDIGRVIEEAEAWASERSGDLLRVVRARYDLFSPSTFESSWGYLNHLKDVDSDACSDMAKHFVSCELVRGSVVKPDIGQAVSLQARRSDSVGFLNAAMLTEKNLAAFENREQAKKEAAGFYLLALKHHKA